MIAFDEKHPLRVLGNDPSEMEERNAMIRARLDEIRGTTPANALARIANTSERTMQGLFQNPRDATPTTIHALCGAVGVSLSEIRGYPDPMPPEEMERLYMDSALTDEDRRIVAHTLQHIYEMRNPPRIHLTDTTQPTRSSGENM